MRIELEPKVVKRILAEGGLNESQIQLMTMEFNRNNDLLSDEALLDSFQKFNKDLYSIILIFKRLGVSESSVVRMLEIRQKNTLGSAVDLYTLEVDG